jgi:hypothetical protein
MPTKKAEKKQKGRDRRRIQEEKTQTFRRSGTVDKEKRKKTYYLRDSCYSANVSLMLSARLESGALCPHHLK